MFVAVLYVCVYVHLTAVVCVDLHLTGWVWVVGFAARCCQVVMWMMLAQHMHASKLTHKWLSACMGPN
jgi:hypothetical protein